MRNFSKPEECGMLAFFRKAFVILLLLILFFRSYSQTFKLDSLKSLLESRANQEYNDILCELGYESLVSGYYDQAHLYSTQLLAIGKSNGDSLQIVRGWAIKASILRRTGFIDSAKIFYGLALPVARRNKSDVEVKDITNSLGVLSIFEGRYSKALEYLFESLSIREKLQGKFDIAVALQNIGLVYYKLRNFEKAISFYSRAEKLSKDVNNPGLGIILVNEGLCYIQLKMFTTAQEFIDEAYSSCKDECDDYFLMSVQFAQGFMFYYQLNYEDAEAAFLSSYLRSKTQNDVRYQLDNLGFLSEISLIKDNPDLAEKYLSEAETVIKLDGRYRLELLEIYSQFSVLYKKLRRYKKVSFYQERYIALKDSLFNEDVATALMRAEAEYVEKEKQAQIESQNKMLAMNDELIYRQRIANSLICVVTLLVIILTIILARNNRQKRIANKLLDEKVKQRTQELEMNRDALQRAWYERDAMVTKTSSDIRGFVATIKGLCSLGLKDIDHPNAPEYLNKLNTTSDQLSDVVGRMVSLRKS